MDKPKVFVTRTIFPEALQRLQAAARVEVWPKELPPPPQVLDQHLQTADGLLSMLSDPLPASRIEFAPNLRAISQMAVGYDNIDLEAATAKGIPVGHTPGVLTETTADFAWALLMAAARRVVEADRRVRDGVWKPWAPDEMTGYDVYGATLGIVGFGRIGQAMARRATGFGMRVLYYDYRCENEQEKAGAAAYCSLEQLLAEADFVSLLVYLSEETRGMIGAEQLAWMKSTAFLINTARGPVIDQDALAAALREGRLAGAALDVFYPEPIPPDHPLLDLDNVIITPHIASASKSTRKETAKISVDNLIAGLEGRPMPFCANPALYSQPSES